MADDPLTELDLDVVTVTRDASGLVSVDGGNLSDAEIVYLLRVAESAVLTQYDEEDEDE